jgi:hypothetical protein
VLLKSHVFWDVILSLDKTFKTFRRHYGAWKNLPGHRRGKLFISRTRNKRTEDQLKLRRNQVRTVVASLMGHIPVKNHLHIVGLFDGDPTCRFWRVETDTVHHIICCCEAAVCQHYNFFGKLYPETKHISTDSLKDLCLFMRNTGAINLY